jgi:1-deoxy-D-xylulose-5-phosphate reductoisomerase
LQANRPQRVVVLGSTGSIGCSTLDVIARHPDRLRVHALSAHSRMENLAEQAAACGAPIVLVPDAAARERFVAAWRGGKLPEIRVGAQALADTAAEAECDMVMAAIVGAAGLPSALAAARAGKRVLLANKEALVAAGTLFMQAVRDSGAELLPIDSEHNAIFQCLPHRGGRAGAPSEPAAGVRRLLLTASGGPFRLSSLEDLHDVTPAQACAHPNWSMGRKISVDSATMLNKGLEVIEAHWLFAMPPERIEVVVHPQSVVHSMVEYEDGSVLAQLGQPDMRTPIAYGLGFPDRLASGVGSLDLARQGRLDFEAPDLERFPCLRLSFEALKAGQQACIALNAANEVAVQAFLEERLPYTWIARVIDATLEWQAGQPSATLGSLEDVLAVDAAARHYAGNLGLA